MFLNHFDSYHLFKEKYPFPKINNLSNSNNLIFTHDLYTHDQNGQYSSGKFEYTEDEYLSLIKEHFEKILPQSLENIGYNPKHDNLILFSDHGMTIGDIKKEGKKNHWMSPSLDFKAKIFCFCFFANEEKKYIHKDACSIISINRLLRSKLLSNGINENNISDNDNYIVNTGNSSLVPQNQNKLNQFAYFRKGRKQNTEKYIFQINPLLSLIHI